MNTRNIRFYLATATQPKTSLIFRIEQRQRINGRNSLITSPDNKTSATKTSATKTSATKTSAGFSVSSSAVGSTDHFRTEQPIAPAPSSDKV